MISIKILAIQIQTGDVNLTENVHRISWQRRYGPKLEIVLDVSF